MAKVARKPLKPSTKASTSAAEVKARKKHKAACRHKSSSPKKTRYYSRSQTAGKIIRKGKRSLPKINRRKVSKIIKLKIPKEPSETALALLINQMGGNANQNAPEQIQPDIERSSTGAEDLTNS